MRRGLGKPWLVMSFISLALCQFIATTASASLQKSIGGVHSARRGRSLQIASTGPLGLVPADNSVYDCSSAAYSSQSAQGTLFSLNNLASDLVISNVTFTKCPAGALLLGTEANSSTVRVTLRDCTFSYNSPLPSASSAGVSALTISGRVVARLVNCYFLSNTAASGAAVYSTAGNAGEGSLEVVNCRFHGNRGQGALTVNGGVLVGISGSNFTFHSNGSAVELSELSMPSGSVGQSTTEITQCFFSDNAASGYGTDDTTTSSSDLGRSGGALLIQSNNLPVNISSCTFQNNNAMSRGGAVAVVTGGKLVRMTDVTLTGNYGGLYGGALVASGSSLVMAERCTFVDNSATQGGAVLMTTQSTLDLYYSNFTSNEADKFAGAISIATGSSVTVTSTTFSRNKAVYAGAIECWNCAQFTGTQSLFLDNLATGSAGALAVYNAGEQVSLKSSVFRGNMAGLNASSFSAEDCSRDTVGAGGAVCASLTVSMSVRSCTFDGNMATSGGAAFVTRQCEIQADDNTCKSARFNLYSDNLLVNNVAVGGAGGALYAANVSAVNVTCAKDGRTEVYNDSNVTKWLNFTDGCESSWANNTATEGGYGAGIATGLAGVREAASSSSSSRTNVSSNSVLTALVELYDFLGTTITRGTYEATGTTVSLWYPPDSDLTNYVTSGYSATTEDGIANFSSLRIRAPPATYDLSFYALPIGVSDILLYTWLTVSVQIRPCMLGEIMDSSGDQCNECTGGGASAVSFYTYNAGNSSCDSCPSDASCNYSGDRDSNSTDYGYLVPEDGYWHSSPLSPQIHECPYVGACTFTNRTYTLGFYQETKLSISDTKLPPPSSSVLNNISEYWQLQCNDGYTGRLCAQCEGPDYGWRSNGRCYSCPSFSLNTLYYCLSYLLTIALLAWTVRATLGRSLGESRALLIAVRSARRQRSCRAGEGEGDNGDGDGDVIFTTGNAEYDSGGSRAGSIAGAGPLYADGDPSGGGSRCYRRKGSSSVGGGEFSKRSMAFSVEGVDAGGGSTRGGFAKDRSGSGSCGRSPSGMDGGDANASRNSGAGGNAGGILEMAAAEAMAQLEAEAARKAASSAGSDDDGDSGPYSNHYGDGYGYGYANGGGGFGGRLSGGGFVGVIGMDTREGSVALLPPAVLPGTRPNIRSRVPRSVLARESRLAQSSGPGVGVSAVAGVGAGVGAVAGVGDDTAVSPRAVEASDGSYGEQAAARRHRLSRMSRAADREVANGGKGASSGNGSGSGGGSARGSGSGSGRGAWRGPFGGPIAEGLSPSGDRPTSSGGTTWLGGVRRRKPDDAAAGEADVAAARGGGGGVTWGGAGSRGSTADGTSAGAGSGMWLDQAAASLRRQNTALRTQLKEDELQREEKPPHTVVLKIMINFLQVTSVARGLDLDFPDAIDSVFSIGATASSAVTGTLVSIDCSLPENGISKAIQRTVLYVCVPWILIMLALPLWMMLYGMYVRRWRRARPTPAAADGVGAGSKRGEQEFALVEVVSLRSPKSPTEVVAASPRVDGGAVEGDAGAVPAAAAAARWGRVGFQSYMVTRMVVTALTVIYYFYPSVTDAILSIYQCEQLDEVKGAYAGYLRSIGFFWELDYGLHCFQGEHLVLTLVVAVPGVLLWCIGVPLGSALWLRHNAARGRLNEMQLSDRYGFLYEDYRRTAYYWESIIMARKLLVVGLLLVTNASQDIIQVLAVMGVVVLAAVLQLYFRPFEEARFNTMELTSLGATLMVLYLCCFFLIDDITQTTKQILSVLILATYLAVLAWFVYCMAVEAWRYAVRILDGDGDGKVTRREVRDWLNLTLGGLLSRVVTFIAEPRWGRRRRRRQRGPAGGDVGTANPAAETTGVPALLPPPSPIVVLGQPSPLAPSPQGTLALAPPPPPPGLMLPSQGRHWISPSLSPTTTVPLAAAPPPAQLKLSPPSPPSPVALLVPSEEEADQASRSAAAAAPPPPEAPLPTSQTPSVGPARAPPGEPVFESYTAVMEMQVSQELSPVRTSPSPPPASSPPPGPATAATAGSSGGGGGGGSGVSYGFRRPSGGVEAATASVSRRVSSAFKMSAGQNAAGAGGGGGGILVLESGELPGTATSDRDERGAAAAAALPKGSLPGSPLEGATRSGGGASAASEPSSGASAPSASPSSSSSSVAAVGASRQGSRMGLSSRGGSRHGAGATGEAGPRTKASLDPAAKPGSARGGSPGGGSGGGVAGRLELT